MIIQNHPRVQFKIEQSEEILNFIKKLIFFIFTDQLVIIQEGVSCKKVKEIIKINMVRLMSFMHVIVFCYSSILAVKALAFYFNLLVNPKNKILTD